jgi:hypothetical protein
MRRWLAFLFVAAAGAALAACGDEPPQNPGSGSQEDAYAGSSGGGTAPSGGGGDVRIEGGDGKQETIADRYEKAMTLIKKRDWDGARDELLEAMHRSQGKDIQREISDHLKLVEQGILQQPVLGGRELFEKANQLYEKKVSVRGTFLSGGEVGKTTYYFWVQSAVKVQCRYGNLPLEDKKVIVLLKEGAQVLVRGTLKSPWGSNPNPYLELSFFKIEKLSAAQKAEMDKATQEGAP